MATTTRYPAATNVAERICRMAAESSIARMFLIMMCAALCPMFLSCSRERVSWRRPSWRRRLGRQRRRQRTEVGLDVARAARGARVAGNRGRRLVLARHGLFRLVVQHENADAPVLGIESILLVQVLRRCKSKHPQYLRLVHTARDQLAPRSVRAVRRQLPVAVTLVTARVLRGVGVSLHHDP